MEGENSTIFEINKIKTEEKNSAIFEYELIPGFRSCSRLLYVKDEQQIYRCKYSSAKIKYYYCYQSKCKAGVAVDFNDDKYCRTIENCEEHTHGPQAELYEKLKVINAIKSEVKNAPSKRSSVREIFDEQCKKLKEACGSTTTLDFKKMRRQLCNIKKRQKMPETPMNFIKIREVFENEKVIKEYAMSRHEKAKPFYVDTIIAENVSYTLFVSPTIADDIKTMPPDELSNFYVFDTTCDVLPLSKEFKQLLIIYIIHNEQAFPFIYALMSKKTEEAYTHMLEYLRWNVLDLRPVTVIVDYEFGLRNAIKNVYPTAKMLNCWFHYINALRQKALKIPELIEQINQNTLAKLLFNKFFYLPVLKSKHIQEAFYTLKADAMDARYVRENMTESIFEPFIKYFETHWIKLEKPINFSVHNEPLRTSSTAENFRKQLNMKLLPTKHGNFYKFLNALCDLDASKSIDFEKSISACASTSALNTTKGNSLRYEQRYKVIQKQYQLFENKQLTLNTLLAEFPKMENCMIEESCVNPNQVQGNDNDESSPSVVIAGEDEESVDRDEVEEESDSNDGTQYEDPLCSISFEEEMKVDPCTILSFAEERPIEPCTISSEEERENDDACKHFKFCQPCYKEMQNKMKGMECKNCVQFALHYKS